MIKAVIFDHDDILAETEPLHCKATIETLSRYNVPLTEEEYYDFWTRNGGDLGDFLKSRGIINLNVEDIRRRRRSTYQGMLYEKLAPLNGSDVVVRNLHYHYALAVASSSYRPDIELSLKLMDIFPLFGAIITIEDVTHGKPYPEGFLLACQKLDVSPAEALAIDDAEKGIVAAHAAGIKSIAIPTARTSNHDFSLATLVIDDIRKITPQLIASL